MLYTMCLLGSGITSQAFASEHKQSLPMQVSLEAEITPLASGNSQIVRRAAFDVGGGSIRMLVADVDSKTSKIARKLFCAKIVVKLNQHLEEQEEEKQFSFTVQEAVVQAFCQLKEAAERYHPYEYQATAASAFRKAGNAGELCQRVYKQCGIPIRVIRATEEGELGFFSSLGSVDCQKSDVIVVDIGTGSFQVTTASDNESEYNVYAGNLGTVDVEKIIRYEIRQQLEEVSPFNPISEKEARQAVLQIIDKLIDPPPAWLKKKLDRHSVRVFATCSNSLSTPVWTARTAWTLFSEELLNRTDKELPPPRSTRRALLCWAIMKALGIEEMEVTGRDALEGNSAGLLVAERYWGVED